jgi:MFS family permease
MSIVGQADDVTGGPMRAHSISLGAWASLASASAAWMFDAMDLNIFTLVLFPSVSELVGSTDPAVVAYVGGLIFAWKFVAVGLGGIVFGVAADRIGRSTTMIITVLIYSVFTGLSALAQNWWQLALYQALAGIGIGGEWAAGAALVAETWPEKLRPRALIAMQLSFAFGFFLRRARDYCGSLPFMASLTLAVSARSLSTCRSCFRPAYAPPVKAFVGMRRAPLRQSVPLRPAQSSVWSVQQPLLARWQQFFTWLE